MTEGPVDTALALVQEVIDWLRPAFSSFGYVVVAVAMFLESAAFTGVVVPGDVILALGGVYAGRGSLSLPGVIASGVVAALTGETIGYVLGRRYGMQLVTKAPVLRRFEHRIDRVTRAIERRGGAAIVLGRFATGVAGFVPFVAGTSGVRWRTFLLFTIPTTSVWAVGVILLGFVVGNNVELIDDVLSTIGWAGLAVAAAVIAVWWIVRRRRARANAAS